ncbi:hypothetical protein C0992_009593 [Termitomyces sp. T32_za158]|nr:hypothetical protein C0992_009593 [Termitomyces sp. T32_za158]
MIMLTRRSRVVLPIALILVLALLAWKADLHTLTEYAPLRPTPQPQPQPQPHTPDRDPLPTAAAAAVEPPAPPGSTPHTTIPHGAHTQGFTLFDDIYLRNGTFYVLTRDAAAFPAVADMISAPYALGPGVDTSPTSQVSVRS